MAPAGRDHLCDCNQVIAINGSRGQTSPPPRGSAQDSAQDSAKDNAQDSAHDRAQDSALDSAKGQTSPPPRLLCLIWIGRRVSPFA